MFSRDSKNQATNAIYVFIDASNVWNAVKSVKKFIEYKTLKDYFKKVLTRTKLKFFITTLIQKSEQEIMTWIKNISFLFILKKGLVLP